MIGLRADIANGDERALYLACGSTSSAASSMRDAIEPARPVGLGRLSPALVDFVDIFDLDGDLVAAAASGDSTAPSDPSPGNIEQWLAGFSPDEHVAWLSRVARGDGSVGAELMRRLRQHTPSRAAALSSRTELLSESLVLALVGGAAGLLLAVWPIHLLNGMVRTLGPGGLAHP